MSKLTKQDFELIAKAIRYSWVTCRNHEMPLTDGQTELIAQTFATLLRDTNESFDRVRFVRAATNWEEVE